MIEIRNNPMRGSHSKQAGDHSEGILARSIEEQTAKLPSDVWLWAALSSMGISLLLQMRGEKKHSLFVGQRAAPLLLIGVYNKLVKIGGSDRLHPDSRK